jgi:hypothetical protein
LYRLQIIVGCDWPPTDELPRHERRFVVELLRSARDRNDLSVKRISLPGKRPAFAHFVAKSPVVLKNLLDCLPIDPNLSSRGASLSGVQTEAHFRSPRKLLEKPTLLTARPFG